ncbi:MAG: succinylglutamate desuccinylase/aspartoacylase family protein [Clostridiaceae bacterium]|nr:succinylglutamate desuccinylase/aspartoacylase family protein [Clostridiaceae bacterium]
MEKLNIFEIPALYRDDFRITGFRFGSGKKSIAIVGSLRGDECQQIYMCSMLVKRLRELEQAGELTEGQEILVIPSLNPYSMNIGKRFWSTDNTDVNRMFPGYSLGETTQRIAAGVFEKISQYHQGIQFASFYMPGRYLPHVHIMKTGIVETERANEFGLPYVLLRTPRPYDTTTLNYNWQIWETEAYSLYSTTTRVLDEDSAVRVVESVLRFMKVEGVIKGEPEPVEKPQILSDQDMQSIRPEKAGIFKNFINVGDKVQKGQEIACIQDVYDGEIIEEIIAPHDGIIFFLHDEPLTYANTAVCKMIVSERSGSF